MEIIQFKPRNSLKEKFDALPSCEQSYIYGIMIGILRRDSDFTTLFNALPARYKAAIGQDIQEAAKRGNIGEA